MVCDLGSFGLLINQKVSISAERFVTCAAESDEEESKLHMGVERKDAVCCKTAKRSGFAGENEREFREGSQK